MLDCAKSIDKIKAAMKSGLISTEQQDEADSYVYTIKKLANLGSIMDRKTKQIIINAKNLRLRTTIIRFRPLKVQEDILKVVKLGKKDGIELSTYARAVSLDPRVLKSYSTEIAELLRGNSETDFSASIKAVLAIVEHCTIRENGIHKLVFFPRLGEN